MKSPIWETLRKERDAMIRRVRALHSRPQETMDCMDYLIINCLVDIDERVTKLEEKK